MKPCFCFQLSKFSSLEEGNWLLWAYALFSYHYINLHQMSFFNVTLCQSVFEHHTYALSPIPVITICLVYFYPIKQHKLFRNSFQGPIKFYAIIHPSSTIYLYLMISNGQRLWQSMLKPSSSLPSTRCLVWAIIAS